MHGKSPGHSLKTKKTGALNISGGINGDGAAPRHVLHEQLKIMHGEENLKAAEKSHRQKNYRRLRKQASLQLLPEIPNSARTEGLLDPDVAAHLERAAEKGGK